MIEKLKSDWPFHAARSPFYYGWVMLTASTLGFLMSIPGQTMGMAAYTDKFIEAFDISRTELSTAYLFGTLISATLLVRAGRFYDDFGARMSMISSSILLGGFVILIANIDSIINWVDELGIAGGNIWLFALLTFGFTGVRFFGQGMLTSASRNVLLLWFRKRRGLMTGVRSVIVTIFYSSAPLGLALLNEAFGWKTALTSVALVVSVVFGTFCLIFVRDNPSVCGLAADGDSVEEKRPAEESESVDLNDARSSLVFWIYALTLGLYSFFSTAIIFHISSIFTDAGRTAAEGFAFFLPVAVIATLTNVTVSWLSDKTELKPLLLAMIMSFVTTSCGFIFLETSLGLWLAIGFFGLGSGFWSLISSVAFVRLFGSRHLGAISGLNATISVVASAGGPIIFGFSLDTLQSYNVPFAACAAMSVVLGVMLLSTQYKEIEPSRA